MNKKGNKNAIESEKCAKCLTDDRKTNMALGNWKKCMFGRLVESIMENMAHGNGKQCTDAYKLLN